MCTDHRLRLFLRSTMMNDQSETSYTIFLRQYETIAGSPEVRKLSVTAILEVTSIAKIERFRQF